MTPIYSLMRITYMFKDSGEAASVSLNDKLSSNADEFMTLSSNTLTIVKPGRYSVWFRPFGSGTAKRVSITIDGSAINTSNTTATSGYVVVDRNSKKVSIQATSGTDSSSIPDVYFNVGDKIGFTSSWDRSAGGFEAVLFYRN